MPAVNTLHPLPIDIDARATAAAANLDFQQTLEYINLLAGAVNPSAVFQEVQTEIFPLETAPGRGAWGETVIAGLLRLGPVPPAAGDQPGDLVRVVTSAYIRDGLGFVQYRIGQYLKPVGRRPGPPMIPGCPDLGDLATAIIVNMLAPDHSLGLSASKNGDILGLGDAAFVFPITRIDATLPSRCDSCTRTDCLVRL